MVFLIFYVCVRCATTRDLLVDFVGDWTDVVDHLIKKPKTNQYLFLQKLFQSHNLEIKMNNLTIIKVLTINLKI